MIKKDKSREIKKGTAIAMLVAATMMCLSVSMRMIHDNTSFLIITLAVALLALPVMMLTKRNYKKVFMFSSLLLALYSLGTFFVLRGN